MGSDDLFKKRRAERNKRKENIRKQKSSNWLIVCEGKETEPNYFEEKLYRLHKKNMVYYKHISDYVMQILHIILKKQVKPASNGN